jgi:hypothetical protein
MSRTAHHIPRVQSQTSDIAGRPLRATDLTELRYSEACQREAQLRGHRPRPRQIRRKVRVYRFARERIQNRSIAPAAALDERRARQRLRISISAVRALVNATAEGRLAIEAAEEVDIPPARHRRNELWQA